MSKTALVIVESPTKAKTIRKFLPKHFVVEASMGHVRDLPQSATDIPEKFKQQEWAKIGVNVEAGFEPLYVVPKNKSKTVAMLRQKLKDASILYLATDEDREGESISWHLLELLKPKIPVKRMVFHEITKKAIESALENSRDVDLKLVRAQETRRILDRLYGYTLSPLIWKKIAFGLSAGRVQSVGLKLLIDRERERLKFKKASYWDLKASLNDKGETFEARLNSVDGIRIASGKDFDENTGKLSSDKVQIIEESKAKELLQKLKLADWVVQSIEEKPFQSRPAPPFITSTLQQEANRKLGFSSRDAMRVAQSLYEEGLITYMRTDSPTLSTEAIQAARNEVINLYGKEYLSPEVRQFTSKAKGAQEAHEAIRPAGAQFTHPKDTGLSGRELALYTLIWKRTVACQMAEAKKLSVSVKLTAGPTLFSASGSRILFPGFLRAYVEGSDDPEEALGDQEIVLPALKEGQKINLNDLTAEPHETKPPARFTEASLVQLLEKEGIGRPSTYASIIDTIIDRGYAKRQGNSLTPTFTGFAVVQILERHFATFVDTKFTSRMEENLDEIAEGKMESLPYLTQFYLGKEGLKSQVETQDKKINANESRAIHLDHLKDVEVRIGRYGAYLVKQDPSRPKTAPAQAAEPELAEPLADDSATTKGKKGKKGAKAEKKPKAKKEDSGELHATIPDELAPADLGEQQVQELLDIQARGPTPLGVDPKTSKNVFVLTGRFGPYVQIGEVTEAEPKPRRGSIPKGVDFKTVTLEQALKYASLPRELGLHPESKKPILANAGRFGPYVMHEGDFRSLKKEDNVYEVTLARALELFAQEKKKRGSTAEVLKDLGPHPEDKKPVQVLKGLYGPYVKHASKNASLPEGKDPAIITMEEALALLAARGAKSGKSSRSKR